MEDRVKKIYEQHDEMPYISPDRNIKSWLEEVSVSSGKTVPKRNMVRLDNGLLPGHIIILWRVSLGTYTNETVISKYFEYTYGIDAKSDMDKLVQEDYVIEDSAMESIQHLTSGQLKAFLKIKKVAGLSKMKRDEVDEAIKTHYTEEELGKMFCIRGYTLSEKGQQALKEGQFVVDKHPKKPGYAS